MEAFAGAFVWLVGVAFRKGCPMEHKAVDNCNRKGVTMRLQELYQGSHAIMNFLERKRVSVQLSVYVRFIGYISTGKHMSKRTGSRTAFFSFFAIHHMAALL